MAKGITTSLLKPVLYRDFSKGRMTTYSANSTLLPVNSVSDSMNVNFDTILGSAVVRPGTTLLGSIVATGKSPLGFTNFTGFNGTPNYQIVSFKGASTSTIYYYDTSWHTSLAGLNNTAKMRFATLGGRLFMVNGQTNPSSLSGNAMISTADAITWDSTNCGIQNETNTATTTFLGLYPTLIKSFKARLLIAGNNFGAGHSKDRVFFSNIIQPNPTTYSVTLTCSGGYVTASGTGLPFIANDIITISGANQAGYNGTFRLITASGTGFTYLVVDSLTTPATGTILVSYSQISFNTDYQTGDWIDVNPDDGDTMTAFGEAADQLLVFKSHAMYRLDVVNKSVDTSNIFNIGAVSQEAVVTCNGLCYFFSGIDIRRTNGGFPEQISRFGVQDFIDAIPQTNWSSVCAGQDGKNVYFSIGTVILNKNQNYQKTYSNVVLKYSTLDETWSVHNYAQQPLFFSNYISSTNGYTMLSADTAGNVQTFNLGTTDNTTDISFFMDTQEIDFGNRATRKVISDDIFVFNNFGQSSAFQIKANDEDWKDVIIDCSNRVNFADSVNSTGRYFKFKWFGTSNQKSPVFEGFSIEKILDEGYVCEQDN